MRSAILRRVVSPCVVLCALLAVSLVLGTCSCMAATMFGAPEQPADDLPDYQEQYAPRWQRVLEVERAAPSFNTQGKGMNSVDAAQWRELLKQAKNAPETQKLRLINGFFNHWRPMDDAAAWNVPEYWAAPGEFIRNRGGDCEDYAIAKYFALRYLGFPPERLRLTTIRQVSADGKPVPLLHAVLVAQSAGNWFVLDNNARPRISIMPHTQYKGRFVPLFSMNELGAWKHRDDPGGQRESSP